MKAFSPEPEDAYVRIHIHMNRYAYIYMHCKNLDRLQEEKELAISLHHLKLTVSEMCHKYIFFCSSSSKM